MNKTRRLSAAAAGAAGLMIVGMATASAATHHTASACPSSRSNGMCIYYGDQNAWDAKPKDNNTLDDWAYPGGQTQISSHIHSVTIYAAGCKVEFYTGEDGGGSGHLVSGSATGAHQTLPSPWYNGTKSFKWFCN